MPEVHCPQSCSPSQVYTSTLEKNRVARKATASLMIKSQPAWHHDFSCQVTTWYLACHRYFPPFPPLTARNLCLSSSTFSGGKSSSINCSIIPNCDHPDIVSKSKPKAEWDLTVEAWRTNNYYRYTSMSRNWIDFRDWMTQPVKNMMLASNHAHWLCNIYCQIYSLQNDATVLIPLDMPLCPHQNLTGQKYFFNVTTNSNKAA